MKEENIEDIFDEHIKQGGPVAMKVDDGEVFIFTETTLRALLAQAEKNPERKVVIFIPVDRPRLEKASA